MSKENRVLPGQVRFNVYTGDLLVPMVPGKPPEKFDEIQKRLPTEELPVCAFINTEGLMIIRDRVNEKRNAFVGTDEELAKKLVVFMGGRTKIQLDPSEESRKGYEVKLNIGIIAWETPAIDEQDIPDGHGFYQLLGVYREYKATGKVSTDKSIRKYATIQKSNKNHPEAFYVGECFFARQKEAIKVKKSNYERTGYFWGRK